MTMYRMRQRGRILAIIENLLGLRERLLSQMSGLAKESAEELPGYAAKDLWIAMYGRYPEGTGSSDTNAIAQVVFDKKVMSFIDESFKFLRSKGAVAVDHPLPGGIYTDLVDRAVREMKVVAPLGRIKGLPLSNYKG